MTEIELRQAMPADTAAIERIARRAWHATYDELLGADVVDETVTAWYASEQLREDITSPASVFQLAIEDDDPIGFGHAGPGTTARIAELHRLYVVPGRWGEGIGRRLFETIETELRAVGFEAVELAVLADNEVGIGFYEAVGCERIEHRTVTIGDTDQPEYVYRKPLE
ncbi:MAG: GNAT family N-acetyltransferase [Halobacteriales archaeon]|nr:GNAT family N-acetyltransferase [Halobacteriales archaeon]